MAKFLLKKRYVAALITILYLFSVVACGKIPNESEDNVNSIEEYVVDLNGNEMNFADILNSSGRRNMYFDYLAQHENASSPQKEIIIDAGTPSIYENTEIEVLDNFESSSNVLRWEGGGSVQWDVDVPDEGLYYMEMKYLPLAESTKDIELSLHINGELPFEGAERLLFGRVWGYVEDIRRDSRGNDIQPRQEQVNGWISAPFADAGGTHVRELQFYFKKGQNTIKLSSGNAGIIIDHIKLYNPKPIPLYDEYRASINPLTVENVETHIQAEKPYRKSSASIVPTYDRSGPATEPAHPTDIRLNIFGGNNWRMPGQWVSWKFDVKEKGDYKIALRYRQNMLKGFFVTRRIYIDGELLFKELENVEFAYNEKWNMKVIGTEDKPYLFSLDEGEHEIRMEVVPGRLGGTIRTLEECIYLLNYLYRKIIMITSVTPDPFRDYQLERDIPELIPGFVEISNRLKAEAKRVKEMTGMSGGEVSLLSEIAHQLDDMVEDIETIPKRLDRFQGNISSLSAFMLRLQEQPLELDYISVMSPDTEIPKANAGFIDNLLFQAQSFIGSFTTDYTSIGASNDNSEKKIRVWFFGGREQAEILKRMVDDDFTTKTGISVKLELAQISLAQAIIAKNAPDVAMNTSRGTPVNLAARNSLYDMSAFEDFNDIMSRFHSTAGIPYHYNGGCYGIPVTLNFHMMFYRKDIFEELGIAPPQTWEDLYEILPIIQRNNMKIGLPYTAMTSTATIDGGMGAKDIFPALLYQRGGQVYTNDLSSVALDETNAVRAFKEWTDFYVKYKFPLEYDFYNRFRSGEMPLGIQPYTMCNFLYAAAPEIRNLWGMMCIPGTLKADGTIDRSEGASGSAAVITKDSKDKKSAWEFVKWWTSADIQESYGREIEMLMGPAARYDTANIEALKRLPWSEHELDVLLKQLDNIVEIPEVPGGYYTSRNIDNAFRNVVLNKYNPREALFEQNISTNAEIKRKRREFGLK
jgi:ABC-type glycerol-3-phosphate transport system substrate-binding protein